MSNEHITDEQIKALHDSMFHPPYDGHANVIKFSRALLALRNAAQPAVVPDDFLTHKDAWRSALVLAERSAMVQRPDINYRDYWRHELAAFDRAYAMLSAAPSAQPAPRFESVGDSIEGPGGRITVLGRNLTRAEIDQAVSPAAQPVGEPFGWWFTEDPDVFCMPGSGFRRFPDKPQHTVECIALYTTPQPSPERAPMTPNERIAVLERASKRVDDENQSGHCLPFHQALIEEVEAHHRITTPSNQPARAE